MQPITGVCFFDTARVDPDRLASVSTVHSVVRGSAVPGYQLVHEQGTDGSPVMAVVGSVDVPRVDEVVSRVVSQLRRAAGLAPVLDLSRAEYVHHRLLVAMRAHGVAVEGASGLVERLHKVVETFG